MEIGVVVVTFNRIDKLKKCLAAYENQHFLPKFIVVVDNCSTDGTGIYLKEWRKKNSGYRKTVICSERNLGGAGGFALGIRKALELADTWKNERLGGREELFIWLGDDDAYPQGECFQKIVDYYHEQPLQARSQIAALCAKVVDNEGESPMHRRRLKRSVFQIKELPINCEDHKGRELEIDIFSFVGTGIRKEVVECIGLPREDYFIFYDDTEYSLRVGRQGKILCIPEAVILHDSLENTIERFSWKNYYMFRNKIYTYRQYFPLFYCLVDRIKILYMIWKFYNVPESWRQYKKASADARAGKLGVQEEYLPNSVVF